jgi:PAS domain S-box-containing protein
MADANATILVVEDERIIAMDLQNRLKRLGYAVPTVVSRGEDAISKAAEINPDLVLMDIVLQGALDGIEAAGQIHARLHIPVVYLTAYADEKTLQRAKITEPYGYLLKPFEERDLHTTIEIVLYKHKMEKELQESEKRYRLLAENVSDVIWTMDMHQQLTYITPSVTRLRGYSVEEAMAQTLEDHLAPVSLEVAQNAFADDPYQTRTLELELTCKDGSTICTETTMSILRDPKGQPFSILGVTRDITERKRKELLEAQSEVRTILTDAIPVLLMNAPRETGNMFINQLCNSIEDVLWKKYLAEVEEVDMNTLGTILSRIMNKLGGDFEIESVDERECVVKGTACPWGTQAQRNPILCMITKGIFSRLAAKVFSDVAVSLDKTIGNKDGCCMIRIRVY